MRNAALQAMLSRNRAPVKSYPLPAELPVRPEPPPLLHALGGVTITKVDWPARAAELRALVQQYEYGYLPRFAGPVQRTLLRLDSEALQGTAILREYTMKVGGHGKLLHVLVVTPKARPQAPLFLGLSFAPYHEVLDDPDLTIPDIWTYPPEQGEPVLSRDQRRGAAAAEWQIPALIARGYGVAIFFPGEIIPDDPGLAEEELAAYRPARSRKERWRADCGAISVWAWTAMRVMDLLQSLPDVDGKRIAIVGHSRMGKAALLAGALDPRFALIIACQAGCGGTAPARVSPEQAAPQADGKPMVETVAQINATFPHWFAINYARFGSEPAKLPFDQHALLALCAPRPVLIAAAEDDVWANPPGQFSMARLADEVYRLLSGEGLDAAEYPLPAPAYVPSRLGWYLRPGPHEVNAQDWATFVDYADRWLK